MAKETKLFDSFGRRIYYLRISVTDRCNLRCIYCMPAEGVPWIPHSEILSYEEIVSIVKIAVELGFTKIRLTGGEPLVRAGLPDFIKMLLRIDGIDEISLTTNGTLLKKYALELKQSGLRRVNISLDTLKADRYRHITRLGNLKDALDGIEAAQDADLHPKINIVVMRGINEDETLDFAKQTYQGWDVRFIELMPFTKAAEYVPAEELQQQIGYLGALEPCFVGGNGPAEYYRLPEAKGTIGFIAPVSKPVCLYCNRMRLTSNGQIRSCLLSDDGIDLKGLLRSNASHQQIRQLMLQAVASKPKYHPVLENISLKSNMSRIGG
ncbi:MAG: GTP 3',8-cyclase MoaA [Chloroflexota bacterium]|nr:GTP 3',8-cyclase MoaA [Chloroflexota bacterium]